MAQSPETKLSRNQARDLDVEAGFLAGLVARDPEWAEALGALGDVYEQRGRFREALQVDEQLKTLRPADPEVRYHLACSLTRSGRFEHAAEELSTALELGYADWQALSRDPDLAPLRAHPAYHRVRSKLRRLRVKPAA
jgi:Flp pilus assembly protein TadD